MSGSGSRNQRQPGGRRPRGHPVRSASRRRRRWPLVLVGALTVVVAVLYFTPLLGVRSVQVRGNTTLGEQEVLDAAQVRQDKPMLQIDTDEIRSRLRSVAKVASAKVTLSWPSTVRLELTERIPVAFLPTDKGVRLIDADGVSFEAAPEPPPGLPELRVRDAAEREPAKRAAMAVLRSLNPRVRGELTAVVVETPRDIHLRLKGGREVHWGSTDESARKAAILPPLLTRPGKVYDVTSPALPTVA